MNMQTRRQREVTPTRPSAPPSTSRASPSPSPSLLSTFQTNFIRQHQTLRHQARSLQSQNRLLTNQLQKLRFESAKGQSRFIQQINLEEQLMAQFQKEKNYQIDLVRLKSEEEISKLRRDKDREIEGLVRELKMKEAEARDARERLALLEKRNSQFSRGMAMLEKEIIQAKEANSQLNDRLTKVTAAEKAASVQLSQLLMQKEEMEREIHLLLQVDTEKTHSLASLEHRAVCAETNERLLNEKIMLLSQGLVKLQQSHKITKQRLQARESNIMEMDGFIQKMRNQLNIKDAELKSLTQNLMSQKIQTQESSRKQRIRQKEVLQLMATNQKLFSQNANLRHRMHDLAITYGFAI